MVSDQAAWRERGEVYEAADRQGRMGSDKNIYRGMNIQSSRFKKRRDDMIGWIVAAFLGGYLAGVISSTLYGVWVMSKTKKAGNYKTN